jgi:hypothetical protein
VVATLEDYEVVRDLVVDVVSEGVEVTVPTTVRELVEAVAAAGGKPASIAQLAKLLSLDKSTVSRRYRNARSRGYVKNLEERTGREAQIVLGDPLPEDVEILPSVERLKDHWAVASKSEDIVRMPDLVLLADDECLRCGKGYEPDERHPERLRCPECVGEAA